MADLLKNVTNALPIPGKKPAEPDPVLTEAEKIAQGMVSVRDVLAPGAMEIDFTYLRIGDTYYRTLFISGYPRQVGANWLSPVINFGSSLDISMFYYPISTKMVLKKLRRKITEMEAELMTEEQGGKIPDPEVELNLEDASGLQDELVQGSEKFFQFSLYITIPATSVDELNNLTKQVESVLGGMLLFSKPAALQMVEGFRSTLPTFEDNLGVTRNMDTTSLATTFPFTSSELTANEGVMYGLNEHNGSLVVFDRFNLENANMVIFAKSGAGKSYAVKLEAMRSLMLGIEVLVIDPENEYKTMAEAIGGSYIPFDFNSTANINPFDLSTVYEAGENELGLKILNLHGLLKVMFGDLSPTEEAVIDRALVLTYKLKGITPDPDTQKNDPPLLEDLYKVFLGMEEPEAKGLADRLERYVKGSATGLFDKPSNINLDNTFTVFGVRDLEDAIRPVAMFVILDYIWTHIRRNRKKRLLIVDEAWFLMQHPDSAKFMFSVAKRARKYFLGLTTITQDVEDFINTDMGKAIVTNSSLQFLMKQSPSSVDKLTDVFYLSSGEKNLLLSSNVGEGLFFAGSAHVALQVIGSPDEHRLITTNPKELQALADADTQEKDQINKLLTSEMGTAVEPDPEVSAPLAPLSPAPAEAALTGPAATPQQPTLNDLPSVPPTVTGGLVGAEELWPTDPAVTTAEDAAAAAEAGPMIASGDARIGAPALPIPALSNGHSPTLHARTGAASVAEAATKMTPTTPAPSSIPVPSAAAPTAPIKLVPAAPLMPDAPNELPAPPAPATTASGSIDIFGGGSPTPAKPAASANRKGLSFVTPKN